MKRLALIAFFAGSLAFAQEHAPEAQQVSAKAEHASENEGNLEVWKWANFLILAAVLGWLIAKSAPPFFRSRTAEIQRGILEATKMREDAEARAAQMETRMASLQSEIEHVRADSKAAMEREAARIRQETEQQMARVLARGEQEIEAQTKHAEKDLRAFSAQLAIQLAQQRIKARMSGDTQNALFDGFLKQLDERAGSPETRL